MSIPLVVNGVSFDYPETGDQNWGPDATGWAVAVTTGLLQRAGGSFPLTADVNFGPNFGLLSKYFTTFTASAAQSGVFRLANGESIAWRNGANSGDDLLAVNSLDQLQYNANPFLDKNGAWLQGFATTVTAAGTTILTVASKQAQQFTGITTQVVQMPAANTLFVGQSFDVLNRSTGVITVNNGAGGLLQGVPPGGQATFRVTNVGSVAGVWDVSFSDSNPGAGPANFVAIYSGLGLLSSEAQLAISRGGTGLGAVASAGNFLTSFGGAYIDDAGTAPGTVGNILISNGSKWVSSPSGGVVQFVSANGFTLSNSDGLVVLNASAGEFSVTIPSAASVPPAKPFYFVLSEADTSGNSVTFTCVDPLAGEVTQEIHQSGESFAFMSDGGAWHII